MSDLHPHVLRSPVGPPPVGHVLAPAAVDDAKPYFEFQVDTPAALMTSDMWSDSIIPDTSRNQRPPFSDDFALAQFVVDVEGHPVPRSLTMLVIPANLSHDRVAAAMTQWRYTPAIREDKRVSQFVQVALRWK